MISLKSYQKPPMKEAILHSFFFLHVHISMCYTTNLSYKKIEGEAIFCYLNIKKSSASETPQRGVAPPPHRPLEPRFPLIGLQTILMPVISIIIKD